jgi:predicted nucleic acid-binding protein
VLVVADAGPILHLHWLGVSAWALPPGEIHVVEKVWREIARHEPAALTDRRLKRVASGVPVSPLVKKFGLDAGEEAALSFGLSKRSAGEILVLCDEHAARDACRKLGLPVTGSIGLLLEAARSGRASSQDVARALEDLPTKGRLHVSPALVQMAMNALPPT